jgi:endonuclease-3
MRRKATINAIKEIFIEKYKDAKTELNYKNDYELLISIILSAQCTDKRVNIITPALFEKYPNTKTLSIANLEDVKSLLNTCSFFNNKAQNIIKMAISVEENFSGIIPNDHKSLMSLAGVGNKTANVFLIELNNENKMAVDTHVFRTSHRLGLSKASNVLDTEKDLVRAFNDNLATLHQAMVLFGRYICTAKNPKCDECFLTKYCITKESFKPK